MNYFRRKLSLPVNILTSVAVFLFLTISCVNEQKGVNTDLSLDKSKQSSESVQIIKNTDTDLKRRAEEYFEAIHNENFDSKMVINYMYPGIFTYNQNNRRVYFETDVVKLIREPVEKLKAMAKQANASYQTEVLEIGKRINTGDKKLYFQKFSMIIERGMDSYTISDYILGISLGPNQEWTFLEVNETATEILRPKFSSHDINQVMNEYERLQLNR